MFHVLVSFFAGRPSLLCFSYRWSVPLISHIASLSDLIIPLTNANSRTYICMYLVIGYVLVVLICCFSYVPRTLIRFVISRIAMFASP